MLPCARHTHALTLLRMLLLARWQNQPGDSPLLWACYKGLTDVAAALLAGGADANAVCALGNRALHMAAAADRADAAALLLLHGADAAPRNACGAAPAQLARGALIKGWLA